MHDLEILVISNTTIICGMHVFGLTEPYWSPAGPKAWPQRFDESFHSWTDDWQDRL